MSINIVMTFLFAFLVSISLINGQEATENTEEIKAEDSGIYFDFDFSKGVYLFGPSSVRRPSNIKVSLGVFSRYKKKFGLGLHILAGRINTFDNNVDAYGFGSRFSFFNADNTKEIYFISNAIFRSKVRNGGSFGMLNFEIGKSLSDQVAFYAAIDLVNGYDIYSDALGLSVGLKLKEKAALYTTGAILVLAVTTLISLDRL